MLATQDEALMMFFTIELLRTVEALHSVHMIHGNINLHNILMRNEVSGDETAAQAAWTQSGTQGWANRGRSQLYMHTCVLSCHGVSCHYG